MLTSSDQCHSPSPVTWPDCTQMIIIEAERSCLSSSVRPVKYWQNRAGPSVCDINSLARAGREYKCLLLCTQRPPQIQYWAPRLCSAWLTYTAPVRQYRGECGMEPGHNQDCGSSSTTKDEAETQTQARQTRGAACFVCCVGFGRNWWCTNFMTSCPNHWMCSVKKVSGTQSTLACQAATWLPLITPHPHHWPSPISLTSLLSLMTIITVTDTALSNELMTPLSSPGCDWLSSLLRSHFLQLRWDTGHWESAASGDSPGILAIVITPGSSRQARLD